MTEDVWVPVNKHGGVSVVHTDPNCRALIQSDAIRSVERSKYPGVDTCRLCDGYEPPTTPKGTNCKDTRNALLDMDPDQTEG